MEVILWGAILSELEYQQEIVSIQSSAPKECADIEVYIASKLTIAAKYFCVKNWPECSLSTIIINTTRLYKVGDFISIKGIPKHSSRAGGIVLEVHSRTFLIRRFCGDEYVIPMHLAEDGRKYKTKLGKVFYEV